MEQRSVFLNGKIKRVQEGLEAEYLEVLIFVKAISDKVGQARIQHPLQTPIHH